MLSPMTSWSTRHRSPPDKTHRFTDWSRRPLTPEQMHYAVSDVTHLRDVFAALDADLEEAQPQRRVSEEMEVLTSPKTYDFHPERAWERPRRGCASRRNSRC